MTPGKTYTVTGYAMLGSGTGAGDTISMRVEFKDQAQNIISSSGGSVTLTNAWTAYTSSAVAPSNAWSVNAVLQLDGKSATVQFDDVVLSSH